MSTQVPRSTTMALLIALVLALSGFTPAGQRSAILNDPHTLIEASGLTSSFHEGVWKESGPQNNQHFFTIDDEEVLWWAKAHDAAPGVPERQIMVQWIRPDGQLHNTQLGQFAGKHYVTSSMPVRHKLGAKQFGEWTVRVLVHDRPYEELHFILGGVDPNALVPPPPQDATFEKLNLRDHGAVAVFDNTHIRIEPNGSYTVRFKRRFKVFNPLGLRVTPVIIPMNLKRERARVVKAYTINGRGEVLQLADYGKLVEAYPGDPASSGAGWLRLDMQGVDVGSIVEYDVEITSVEPPAFGRVLFDHAFRLDFPALKMDIRLTAPRYIRGKQDILKVALLNTDLPSRVRYYPPENAAHYHWTLTEQPAHRRMQGGSLREGDMAELVVTDFTTWEQVANWAGAHIRSHGVPRDILARIVRSVTRDSDSDLEAVEDMVRWARKTIRNVPVPLGVLGYKPQEIYHTLDFGFADAKDKTVLLNKMLQEYGLIADRALLRSKSRGPVHADLPSPKEFDHAMSVVHVDGQQLWLDATAKTKGLAFGELPEEFQGVDALILGGMGGRMVKTPSPIPQDIDYQVVNRVLIEDVSGVEGTLRITVPEAIAPAMRQKLRLLNPFQQEQFIRGILRQLYPPAEFQRFEILNLQQLQRELQLNINYRSDGPLPAASKPGPPVADLVAIAD